MESRHLGQTSLSVSRLGLGLAALGRPGYINLGHAQDLQKEYDSTAMEAHCHAVLDTAWQLGIRYFDAARSYGQAEAFLSSWLKSRQIQPGTVTVGSKWGYTYTAAWKVDAKQHEIKDHSLSVLRRQVTESRHFLGNHLALYQIHSATLESGVLDNRDVIKELAQLRTGGLHIGLSLSGPNQAEVLRRAIDVKVAGERVFDCVQATWNVLEPSVGPALQEARNRGLGIIVKEALANGRLTSRNQDPAFAHLRAVLERQAERLHTTVDALALAGVLAQPWADIVLSGAATVEHLQSNIASCDVGLDPEAAEQLGSLAEPPHDYWSTRAGLPWN